MIWRMPKNIASMMKHLKPHRKTFWSIEKWAEVLEKSKLHLKPDLLETCLIPLIINLFVKFFSFLISLHLYVLLLLFFTESDIAVESLLSSFWFFQKIGHREKGAGSIYHGTRYINELQNAHLFSDVINSSRLINCYWPYRRDAYFTWFPTL